MRRTELSLTWSRYRVVRDHYLGFEAQISRWWFPVWMELNYSNTNASLEAAEALCRRHAISGRAILYLGRLPTRTASPCCDPLARAYNQEN
jgi:hypothetical protein